jgi:hypothetical protein
VPPFPPTRTRAHRTEGGCGGVRRVTAAGLPNDAKVPILPRNPSKEKRG